MKQTRSTLTVLVTVIVLSIIHVNTVDADTIINSFGLGDAYHGSARFILKAHGRNPPADLDWAFQFTVTGGDYRLEQYEMAFTLISGADNDVEVTLHDGTSYVSPGAVMESFDIHDQIVPAPGSIVRIASPTMPMLVEGHSYWIGVSVKSSSDEETLIGWQAGYSVLGRYARRADDGPWVSQGVPILGCAWRLSGTPSTVQVKQETWGAIKESYR